MPFTAFKHNLSGNTPRRPLPVPRNLFTSVIVEKCTFFFHLIERIIPFGNSCKKQTKYDELHNWSRCLFITNLFKWLLYLSNKTFFVAHECCAIWCSWNFLIVYPFIAEHVSGFQAGHWSKLLPSGKTQLKINCLVWSFFSCRRLLGAESCWCQMRLSKWQIVLSTIPFEAFLTSGSACQAQDWSFRSNLPRSLIIKWT